MQSSTVLDPSFTSLSSLDLFYLQENVDEYLDWYLLAGSVSIELLAGSFQTCTYPGFWFLVPLSWNSDSVKRVLLLLSLRRSGQCLGQHVRCSST